MRLTEVLAAVNYRVAGMVMGTTARIYFREIATRDLDRIPAKGPLLVVANHPASITDVIVLATAVPRHLHFLAMAGIFKPWIRGFALRLCGTLPIYRRQDDPTQMHRNEDTFRACHELLDRGGAVLIFPEGTSITDRQIVPIKTGAARLALAQERRPDQAGRLTLLPIGLHFADRTGFWTEVTVSVGTPIDLSAFVQQSAADEPETVRQLTAHIQGALEGLILHVPETERVPLVHAIEEIYRTDLEADTGARGIEAARGIAECIEHFSRVDPERIERARARVDRYYRHLAALRVHDETVNQMLPAPGRGWERLRLVVLGLLGLLPALIGLLIHYVPYRLTAAVGMLTSDPTRKAAFRMGSAVVWFPLTYAALAWLFASVFGWSPLQAIAGLLFSAALGLHALLYINWLARQSLRIRLVILKVWHRRSVARLRRERHEIIRMCDASKREFRTTRANRETGAA